MTIYDVIVIGSGEGLSLAFRHAEKRHLKTALIDMGTPGGTGHPGGTCLNVGCVPSKTLIYPADRINEIREAGKLGIRATLAGADFGAIMRRMRGGISSGWRSLIEAIKKQKGLDFFPEEARFVNDYTLALKSGKTIKGKKIIIASGSRTSIPPIAGLDRVPYLTSDTVLGLRRAPGSLAIIGGGYIALEYANFFQAMGTAVTIVEEGPRILGHEEPEISELLLRLASRRMRILTNAGTEEVTPEGKNGCALRVRDFSRTGRLKVIKSERLLVATGRRSNADILMPQKTGVRLDARGYIKVNSHLETGKKNIWALGDATGKQMFTHAGDREAEILWHNLNNKNKKRMDWETVPHAVFCWPPVASVGLIEAEARARFDIKTGVAKYSDVVMGRAMKEKDCFAKAIVEKRTGRILGFHIIGPRAADLIQEVVNAVAEKRDARSITEKMHIFPALSNLIPAALENVK